MLLYGGSFFVLFKAVLKVGAQATLPLKGFLNGKTGILPGPLLGMVRGSHHIDPLLRILQGCFPSSSQYLTFRKFL